MLPLPRFCGFDAEDIHVFLERLEAYFAIKGITDDTRQLAILKSQVQDALDVKFDSALPADTYLQKKKQLIQVFDSPHKRLQARIMIKNLTLNPNESPNDFYRRLLIAAKRLDNLSEHEI